MNANQKKKIAMFVKVQAFMDEHLPELNAIIPLLSIYYSEYASKMDDLNSLLPKLSEDITQYTKQAKKLRNKITTNTLILSSITVAYGASSENKGLMDMFRYTKSYLASLRQLAFYFKCNSIVRRCEPMMEPLFEYGYPRDTLNELKDLLEAYYQIIPAYSDGKASNAAVLQIVSLHITELDTVMKAMDNEMRKMKVHNRDLYREYKRARRIKTDE